MNFANIMSKMKLIGAMLSSLMNQALNLIHLVDGFGVVARESSPDIFHATNKFNKKIMVFGGISKKYCTPLIAIKGSINADSYVEERIDDSGLILGMSEAYGPFQWTLM